MWTAPNNVSSPGPNEAIPSSDQRNQIQASNMQVCTQSLSVHVGFICPIYDTGTLWYFRSYMVGIFYYLNLGYVVVSLWPIPSGEIIGTTETPENR